jgi:hypothetical protein
MSDQKYQLTGVDHPTAPPFNDEVGMLVPRCLVLFQ